MTETVPRFVAAGCSEQGKRKANEDAMAFDAERGVFAVADGIGSGSHGGVAARAAVGRVVELNAALLAFAATPALAELLAQGAEMAVQEAQQAHAHGCQTTLAFLVARGEWGAIGWVGDSRVYRLRDGVLELLTRDHRHARHVLSRWVGHRPGEHAVDEQREEFALTSIRRGDVFALVTDGVGDTLPPDALTVLMQWVTMPDIASGWGASDVDQEKTRMVANEIVSRSLAAGASDNCTAVVVRVV